MSLDPRDLSENTDLYRFDSQALAQLAVGTSVFIACVLTAADILPLWPISDSLLSLALRLVGQWIVVVVVWFVGFQAIAHTLKFISKGVVVTDYGIKLSRLPISVRICMPVKRISEAASYARFRAISMVSPMAVIPRTRPPSVTTSPRWSLLVPA